MSENGRPSHKQVKAIAALMEHNTIADAAKAAGIGESTIRRWMTTSPAFRAALRDAETRLIDEAFGRLAANSHRFISRLIKNADCGNHAVETRTSLGAMQLIHKRRDEVETEQRLSELERQLKVKGGNHGASGTA